VVGIKNASPQVEGDDLSTTHLRISSFSRRLRKWGKEGTSKEKETKGGKAIEHPLLRKKARATGERKAGKTANRYFEPAPFANRCGNQDKEKKGAGDQRGGGHDRNLLVSRIMAPSRRGTETRTGKEESMRREGGVVRGG